MNRRIAKKIAKRARLFLGSWTWAFGSNVGIPLPKILKVRRILARRHRRAIKAETHVIWDGVLRKLEKGHT
jgi:hypothetical protein